MTHWQSPNFYAYFPANSSFPGLLGEMLSGAFNVIGFSWIGSPAATELETVCWHRNPNPDPNSDPKPPPTLTPTLTLRPDHLSCSPGSQPQEPAPLSGSSLRFA